MLTRFSGPHHFRINTAEAAGKTPLLFVHGNTSTGAWWAPLMRCFDPQRYFCVAPDLNGFGQTKFRPIGAWRGVRDWARDLTDLLDRLGMGIFCKKKGCSELCRPEHSPFTFPILHLGDHPKHN
ncbi:MAG: alpha/beta hydrolase [Candidatus Cyclonatronum sp.]|uniref:alpha/beta fold hydrolase n=1 Tax=Cyclonatronum sp. TaxID=3024185 RepID=UPI0025BC0C95|nr:alpha/beta fold hydrolase [Cyclonatronum sp.]MCH8486750.1 alpha/beta hydrolase [Cyclonatronum sp.]